MITSLGTKLVPGLDFSLHSDNPYMTSPILGGSQVVRADKPGNEPDIASHYIEEDCSLFGGKVFAKGNISSYHRKMFFSKSSKCKDYTFDTKTICK